MPQIPDNSAPWHLFWKKRYVVSYNGCMNAIRAGVVSAALTAMAGLSASGCAPELRAVPGPAQAPIAKGMGVFEYRDGLTVSVTPVSQPPVGTGSEFIAFGIHVHNGTQATFGIDVSRVQLGLGDGAEWVQKAPVAPDDLLRAYQSARASAAGVHELTPPELVRAEGHYGAVHGYRSHGYYGYGYPYCWPDRYYIYNGYYYDSIRDAYLHQQETAAFLARLLRSQEIPPGFIVGGFIVFPQPLHKGDDFQLLVPVGLVPGTGSLPISSRPGTTPAPTGEVFEFHFVAK